MFTNKQDAALFGKGKCLRSKIDLVLIKVLFVRERKDALEARL